LEQLLLEGDLDRIQSQLDSLCKSAEAIDDALSLCAHLCDEARHMSNVAKRLGRELRKFRVRSKENRR